MKWIGKSFATTVFVMLTTICLVLVCYDNSVAQTGTVWAWGASGFGQLGDGTTNNSSTPVQVTVPFIPPAPPVVLSPKSLSFRLALSGVIAIAGGDEHSLALKSDGTVWAWGYNGSGQLGDGTTNNSSTPVQVNGLSSVIAVAGGGIHSIAVQSGDVFFDIPAGYWAEQYIYAIYNDGITKGCSQSPLNYCPSEDVTRDQMAAFIIRALYGENFTCNGGVTGASVACATTTPYFSNVLPTDPVEGVFFPYIQKLKELNITTVTGMYNPSEGVTRGQMAAFLVRARQVRAGQGTEEFTNTTTPYFSDVPAGSTFFNYVQKLKDDNITTVTGTYGVDEIVTRDQMAAFVARSFLGMH